MAKLSQLLMLEAMLETYDNMSVQDACVIRYQGMCIEGLVDDIIAMLDRLLSSKTRLSCRNVLVTNFETMTDTGHWLQRKLFMDLPKALGKVLRDKIDQMVDLLNALMVKVIDVEADFADRFFERMKKRCRKYSTTGFDLWKAQQSKITIKGLVTYQVDLTADMLSCGILKDDRRPNGEEVQNVDKDKLALKLTDKSRLTDDFIRECAKLRRYSHWEGNRFMIDYQQLRKYLFRVFGKLTREQHIKMYKYDIQMKQIYEDIKRLEKEEENEEIETKDSRYSSAKERIINYVDRLEPMVKKEFRDNYYELWNGILDLKEVKESVYDKGKQQGTTFNRNLVAQIIHQIKDKVYVATANTVQMAECLEPEKGADHPVRQKLGEVPCKTIKKSVDKYMKTRF